MPFVYELREILDWSATATTLRLYDWLKLEVRGVLQDAFFCRPSELLLFC